MNTNFVANLLINPPFKFLQALQVREPVNMEGRIMSIDKKFKAQGGNTNAKMPILAHKTNIY